MSSDPAGTLVLGSNILEPLFLKHGFVYRALDAGSSSGGQFASGEFRKDNRWLEFHFRRSLGMVTCHLGSRSMSHQEYMRSVLERPNASHYPGFSSDPLEAFRQLYLDLEEHCGEFLEGTDDRLLHRIEDAQARRSDRPTLPE
jgi:hypothetical protein